SELFTGISNRSITRSIILGSIVFIIWILPEGLYPYLGYSEFDPTEVSHLPLRYLVIIFRVLGAALVVPIFEELFWRSFLARWIIQTDFKKVQIGYFTPLSFVIISLFFGIEHHRWLVGIAAGILYNWLLYKEKKLLPCIIAHLVTNLLLASYVLITSQWSYW
ncbi:CAAX prenyl protease-related protein, partial [candidate division KSB1 bacterium]|nr:CAAX prenyl protease-related protein [candidate division KSB1 bacterium]